MTPAATPTNEPHESSSAGSPQPVPRLSTLLSLVMSAVPALAIAGTAFLFLAGYTYLDTYRRYLGLGFAVTEVSTAEVLVQGYVVLWFALFDRIWHVLAVLVLPSAIAIVVVIGLALLIRHGRRRGWRWCEIAADRIMAIPDRASALPNYLFTFAIVTAVLVVAQPAGDRAVRREYRRQSTR